MEVPATGPCLEGMVLLLVGHLLQTPLSEVCGGVGRPARAEQLRCGCSSDSGILGDLIVSVIGELGFGHIAFIYVVFNLPALCRALVLFGTKPCAGTVRLLVDAGTLIKLGDAMLGHHCELDNCGSSIVNDAPPGASMWSGFGFFPISKAS